MMSRALIRVAGSAVLILAGAALAWATSAPLKPAPSPATQQHMMMRTVEQKVAELEKQVAALEKRLKDSEGRLKAVTERFNAHRHSVGNQLFTASVPTLELLMQRKDGGSWVVLTKTGVSNPVARLTEPPAE